ncbi:3-ketoacyl-(acyl-carrier-protein) reductase [Companilactobacillus tucceti DSM 20183]|uniref:3-ketoacyl-(Acyl-carrier-protein) reductase n=2 Tax=Companilactobacillus tucceti TaxID=238012 RepID=A0A0R1J6R5_9LACO|nr:3-ketoacyl-(acyl-carrier-protein) reductase [Companilactobacillus tucceti DSM 20183]
MAEDFTDKVVLITGAASGIGLSQAKLFKDNGAKVIAVDKNEIPLDVMSFNGDVSQSEFIDNLFDSIKSKFNTLDIVCNTAGILDGYSPVTETSLEQWQNILNTNLTSQFMVIKKALPMMLDKGKGVFVNMASIAGLVANGGGVAYTASKHAVIGMTKQLDIDYANQGIRANCIAPGAIDTPMNAADFAGDGKMAKWVADQTPAKRWAKPEEVAELALFLASDRSDYIHGSVVPIDGGWTAQ